MKKEKKKKMIDGLYKGVSFICFAGAVSLAVYGCYTTDYMWLLVAFLDFICGGFSLVVNHFIRRSDMLAECCNYKDGIINRLHEQRNRHYERIARLTDECNELHSQLKVWEGEADEKTEETAIDVSVEEYRKIPISVSVDEVRKFAVDAKEKCSALLSDDNMQINITVTPDKVLPSMSSNLYIQPKDEFSRWWKIRGYDTELPKANKEYYIYIRLAHKGFDGEVRFLAKPRLVQNEVHRFIQVGTISPVTGGRRTVSYSLDGFRFKQIRKGRAYASK